MWRPGVAFMTVQAIPMIMTTHRFIFLCFLAAAVPIAAHHGVSTYDMQKEAVLEGTVKEWRWGNPHTWLYLTVTGGDGKTENWSIEGAPPNWMTGQGWTTTSLKSGEKVSIKFHPSRLEPKGGILMEVHQSDGKVLKVNRPARLGGP
jgi:hypothetical protein